MSTPGLNRRGWLTLAFALSASLHGCAHREQLSLHAPGTPLTIRKPALYPETILWDPNRDAFLVSSIRHGAVYAVDRTGAVTQLVDDPRLCSVLGIAVDATRDRLWVTNADLGVSLKPSEAGPKRLAGIGLYSLQTGEALRYIDLASLSEGEHLLNGLALDGAGNAYATDSFSPEIYRVDAQGEAKVFARDERFRGDGINLNGLVVHPDGYLLVIKKSDGQLFKVLLDEPTRVSPVALDQPLVGGDGLSLWAGEQLLVVANQVPGTASNAVFALRSTNSWASASVIDQQDVGSVYPTTGVLRDDKYYVVHSRLNELIQASPEQQAALQVQASIRQVGALR